MKQRREQNIANRSRTEWKCRIVKGFMAALAVSMVLGGCQGAKSVPKMEKVAEMNDDKIQEKLTGFTKAELIEEGYEMSDAQMAAVSGGGCGKKCNA